MERMDFMEFGRQNSHCHMLDDGFMLWKVTGKDDELPVVLEGHGDNLIVHVIVWEGVMKMGWVGKLYPIMKGSFVNFMDGHSLQIQEVSWDAKAYVMFFTHSFIRSLLKGHPPFTPSYVIRVKLWPIMAIPSKSVIVLQKRIEMICELLANTTHRFRTDMVKCALLMFMFDMVNELEHEQDELDETGRKSILFKQFIKLLLDHIREQHSVAWYASQLCVTPQYLNRAVKCVSQKTVSEHICTTLIGTLIERLESTEDPVAKIAEDFHFPDQATLTKFFKKQTGKTPSGYRKLCKSDTQPTDILKEACH